MAHRIKEKENLLYPCQKDMNTEQGRQACFILDLYIDYIKNLVNFIIICQLFSISLKELRHFTKSLHTKELFLIFLRIDVLFESIMKFFHNKEACKSSRLLTSIIYLLFIDLLKLYQSYYLLITVMLERLPEMDLSDTKRAFIVYTNFVRFNKEIRSKAVSICKEFSLVGMDLQFYDVDFKIIETMRHDVEQREKKENSKESSDSSADHKGQQLSPLRIKKMGTVHPD